MGCSPFTLNPEGEEERGGSAGASGRDFGRVRNSIFS
jgi:hypothetical protein